jgi:hypothetical protein
MTLTNTFSFVTIVDIYECLVKNNFRLNFNSTFGLNSLFALSLIAN